MKTLSIRQPWADLIIQGQKTLELRTWTVRHRGPLAIHASQTVERDACLAHDIDPDQVTTGAVIGVVDLVEIMALDAASYEDRRAEHLADAPFASVPGPGHDAGGQPHRVAPTLYGWRLANPRPLSEPVPVRGRMALFETELTGDWESQQSPQSPLRSTPPQSAQADFAKAAATFSRPRDAAPRDARPFELRVLPLPAAGPGEPAYRLALHQRAVEAPSAQQDLYDGPRGATRRVAELGGPVLRAVADHVMEALRANGYKPTELGGGRREPFALAEESGVRLALLFLAVRPITKVERIEVIGQGIRAMTSEEAYYWYSKCTSGSAAERAQRALRVMLAEE